MQEVNGEIILHDGRRIVDEYQLMVFRKLLELHPEKDEDYSWDEIGTATLIVDIYDKRLKYCPQYGDWLLWDGTRYARQGDTGMISDKVQTILNLLNIYTSELGETSHSLATDYRTFLRKLRTAQKVKNIIDLMKTNPSCRLSVTDFDANPYILNMPIGAYDLKKEKFLLDRESLNLTQVTTCDPADLEQGYVCTRWYDFISEIMCGDKEQAAFLQRALGYSLLGDNREECMFVALGQQTRNGKGTLFQSIMTALGNEYSQGSDPQLICEKNGKSTDFNAPQPALRKLTNCRLVVMAEAPRDSKLDAASTKAMTGRDTLTTRGLYENSFDFVPQFTMWLNTNYLPAVTDDTIFKSDRVWVIKFNAHFDADKRDMDLKQTFADPKNRPTILRWLIDGCEAYLKQGLNVPEVVHENTMEFREKFDRLGNFLNDETVSDTDGMIPKAMLYGAYRTWCCKTENNYRPISSTMFYTDLQLRGIRIDKANIYGLKLETPSEGKIRLM